MIVLYESELKTRLVPVGAIVHLRKKPPGVAVLLRNYDLDRWDSGLFYLHHGPPSLRPDRPGRRSSCQKRRLAATSNRSREWVRSAHTLWGRSANNRLFLDQTASACYCFSEHSKKARLALLMGPRSEAPAVGGGNDS